MSRFKKNVHNFEDTYAGLSDEEEDALNDETFGSSVPLDQDFVFGTKSSSTPTQQPTINYADAARTKPQPVAIPQGGDELKPMAALWGEQGTPDESLQSSAPVSLDQIESQIPQSAPQQQQQQQQQIPGQIPGQMPFGQPQFFYPPGFMPPPGAYPPQFNMGQVPPGQFPGFPIDPRMIQQGQFPPPVQRIMQFCGVMNPRDKDFVTRIQLSHIVTDDPYNEDFYFQVYRLLKTGNSEVNNNSIAQAYLDFSGHRLGGRYQKAEVALQRMQQQVQKAVTVAKERPRTGQMAKEGALGKISFSNGKMPRKALEIIKPKLPEITKGGRKSILLQIEDIYQHVLNLESAARERKEVNSEELWDSLKLFDERDGQNPFIQVLSYEKGLKIFPRIFNLLDRQQKLTIITLIFANLSLIKIISKSSFKLHKNDEIPTEIQKTIELFQMVVMKPIAVITEIIGLLTILIEHNNVSFLTTSKLGTSLITILLTRAEIMKQEDKVSSEDSQHWAAAYDKLFSSLETKLPLVFPSTKSSYDDSYIWQFFATLALSGKINHQRIIVDEIRDEIFGSVARAKEIQDPAKKIQIITNLNFFLNVIGLHANGEEIVELK
ncbi:DNA topoisomerase 2-associated protein PAT1 [Cyberlindnera fabianii]|uniref:DNA topoisomerase 2-associated protein PAT1 n=1 Tax=Cyberlindnera fabianii TaxID=36022 RepID=A0A1V2LBX2_CYBFA|nr:DNA topoisomerase 2-associated protein PAT1 [Cyberlindnera fabianii]